MPQQVADFFECRMPRKVVDVVSTVRQHAAIAVEITDCRRCGDCVFEPRFGLRGRSHDSVIIAVPGTPGHTSPSSPKECGQLRSMDPRRLGGGVRWRGEWRTLLPHLPRTRAQ